MMAEMMPKFYPVGPVEKFSSVQYYTDTGNIPVGSPSLSDWARMKPEQREAYIVDFWSGQPGVEKHVAQGITDALWGESRFNPLAVNRTSGSTGFEQALGSRKTELLSQRDWAEPYTQLQNMLREVTGGDKIATQHWAEIKAAKTRPQAKQLWSQYFERPGPSETGTSSAVAWNVSPNAIASEQARSNTDVRKMTPEEYLSLLPPIEFNEANRAKRRNLDDSLAAGDMIEQIPSLDVTPRGDKLHVADWDGRNRAQAAIDAGVDEIPVAIRGVPGGRESEFKLLVGDKKVSLPYTFLPVPKLAQPRPIVTADAQARQIVPQAFVPGPVPGPTAAPTTAGPMVGPATKPDFYPEIVAGVNKDIVNPRGMGYRGTGVPDLATNATAGGRIAAANQASAGQVGLGGGLGSTIGSALSAINPIGSAQAAETPPAEAPPQFFPVGPGAAAGAPEAPPEFHSPKSPMGIPGLDTFAPPLANRLFNWPTGVGSAIYAATQAQPGNMQDWYEKQQAAQTKTEIPETAVGRVFGNVLNAPGIGAGMLIAAGLSPEQIKAIAPYVEVASLAMPLLGGMSRGLRRGLAPGADALVSHITRTPEMRAAAAVNRRMPAELAAGGVPPTTVATDMARAQAAGIPLAPMHFRVPGGPINTLLSRSLEHSPEATGEMRKFVSESSEGIPTSSTTPPRGGTLERMDRLTESAFGTGSAHDIGKGIKEQLKKLVQDNDNEMQKLGQLEFLRAQLAKTVVRLPSEVSAKKAGLKQLADKIKASNDNLASIGRDVYKQKSNQAGLNLGVSILEDSVRPEHIRDFYKTASNDAADHLRIGVQDALKKNYRSVSPGNEPLEIALDRNVRAKIIQAFGGSTNKALNTMRDVDLEVRVAQGNRNLLRDIDREGVATERDKRLLNRFLEAAGHLVVGAATGHHMWSPTYWGLRAARQLADLAVGGGGIAPRTKGQEIAKLLSDPNAAIDTTGRGGLLQIPPRPTKTPIARPPLSNIFRRGTSNWLAPTATRHGYATPETVNALSRAAPWMYYNMLFAPPEAPEQSSPE